MSILDTSPKSTPQVQPTHPLFTSTCYIKSSPSVLSQIQLSLYSDFISFTPPEKQQKKVLLKWALVQSFCEELFGNSYFGFSLTKSSETQDFYFVESEVLETWLGLLSSTSILTGFENDFITIKKIDSGNFGDVNLCQDITSGTEYAVKCIQKRFISTAGQIKHLKSEIKSMRITSHPCCVKLHRVYEEPDSIMLLMEYVPHGTLLSRLQKLKKFSENDVSLIASTLINVLIYFNTKKIIHRDLKLENILMSSAENNFEIKVADFGVASCSKKPQSNICGTPGFLAPEAFTGEVYDGRFDVFTVGVVCYTLLTGKLPFAGKTQEIVLEKNKDVKVKFEKRTWKEISKFGWNFVQGLMNKDPRIRPKAEQAQMHPWISGSGEWGKVDISNTKSGDLI